jgi:hypothetical protein
MAFSLDKLNRNNRERDKRLDDKAAAKRREERRVRPPDSDRERGW